MKLDNKRIRRCVLGWWFLAITLFMAWAFINPPDIPEHTAEVLKRLIEAAGVVFALYQWMRSRDEGNDNKDSCKPE